MNYLTTAQQDSQDNTVPNTLWSSMLLEILIDTLNRKRPDKQVTQAIKNLHQRNFSTKYIAKKIFNEIDAESRERMILLAKQI